MVESLSGGEVLREYLYNAQSRLRKTKTLQQGSARLLQALQQVRSSSGIASAFSS